MSEATEVEKRLSKLEAHALVMDERFRTMPEDVRQLRDDLGELNKNLALLLQREIQRGNEDLLPRVTTLEKWRDIVVGGSLVVWVIICVSGIVLYDWMKAHFDLMKK